MASNQKTIFVYDDFSSGSPILMGTLYVNIIKGGESWQKRKDASHLSCTTATICWEYTTKHEWAAFDLKQIRMAHFFLMTKKQLLLLGQCFAH